MTNSEDRIVQAASWIARGKGNAPSKSERAAHLVWLAENESNAAAAIKADNVWAGIADLADDKDILAAIPMPAAANDNAGNYWRKGGFAAAAVVVMTFSFVAAPPPAVAYQTAKGEQRTIDAPRGVRIVLNTASRVSVSYGWLSRRIVVEQGEADISIAKRFMSSAEVQLDGNAMLHTNAGRLVVRNGEALPLNGIVTAGGNDPPLRLGYTVRAKQGGLSVSAQPMDRNAATAWQRGLVVFDNVTLDAALSEFSRYQPLRYNITPRAAALRISGTYRLTEAKGFVATLPRVHRVSATTKADGTIRIAVSAE